jgi:hypothetical protein
VFSHARFDILAAVFKVVTSSSVKKFTVVSEGLSSFLLSHGIIVKLETENSFETPVNFYRTIKRHIPDDSSHH